MQNTIKDIFYGHNVPFETSINQSIEYRQLEEKLTALEECLRAKLRIEEYRLYEDIVAVQMKILSLTSEKRFEQGFKIGCKLSIELLYKDDALMEKTR